ncbi:MAG: hemolysin III family protein [Chitinophagales bacterium]
MQNLKKSTFGEELANSITHGIGAVFSIIGFFFLMHYTAEQPGSKRISAALIYGISLILLYLASTLYHSIPHYKVKKVMRVFDHVSIYLLIAGSYTPFALLVLDNTLGDLILYIVWGVAIVGSVFKIFFTGKFDKLSTLLYIAMGWVAIIAFEPLLSNLPTPGMVLLATGGVLYTGGTVFYMWNKLKYNHAIWHLFVMGGSAAHFFAILFYVLPMSNLDTVC